MKEKRFLVALTSALAMVLATARVLSLEESACVPYGCFDHLLLTKETSRLDPGVVEQKYYAEGVGFILAVMVKGGDERSELVRITTH